MNPLITTLAIPTALTAPSILGNTVDRMVGPFAQAMQSALGQLMGDSGVDPPLVPVDLQEDQAAQSSPWDHWLTAFAAQSPGNSTLGIDWDTMQSQVNQMQLEFQQRLQSLLAETGISVELPINLQLNPQDGGVDVVGEHPQKVVIEALLASDQKLTQAFQQLTALEHLLHGISENIDFAQTSQSMRSTTSSRVAPMPVENFTLRKLGQR